MDDDLEQEIFPAARRAEPERSKKSFKPWHKPRKQHVRNVHLGLAARRVFASKPDRERTTLTYLGLPGSDFLDLRFLLSTMEEWAEIDSSTKNSGEICGSASAVPRPNLRFLGFDTSVSDAGSRVQDSGNVAYAQLVHHANVDPTSMVLHDDFKTIGSESTVGFRNAKEFGPFDVVNLDLCGSIFTEEPLVGGRNISAALGSLLSLQQRVPARWALLITTRVDREVVHAGWIPEMDKILVRNAESETFSVSFSAELGVQVGDWPASSGPCFQRGLCVALIKWLVVKSGEAGFSVEILAPRCYSVDPRSEFDMVSFAFLLTRRNRPISMVPSARACESADDQAGEEERRKALSAIQRVAKMENLDAWLNDCPSDRDRLAEESGALLEECGYSLEEYRAWLETAGRTASSR